MQMDSEAVKIEGVVERIVFFNEENFYCIASMRATGKNAALGQVTIAGVMPALQCGETVEVSGSWANHSSYGAQLKVKSFESRLPSGVYGLEKFLGSGLIEGIGAAYAKKIVDKFGEDTLRIIDTESARLLEIKGIGAERVKRIRRSWTEQKALRDIMIFLRAYGIGMAMCARIMQKFGEDAPRVVREEPYRLAREIDGIGFKTADMIALNIGVPNESRERVAAGVMYILHECEADGSTCAPSGEIASRAAELLNVDDAKCREAVSALVAEGLVKFVGDSMLQSDSLDYAERRIASNLKRILNAPSALPPIKAEAAAEWAKARAGFDFAPEQTAAIVSALSNKVSVITGGPGTGKTTILRALCEILKAKKCLPVLAAPTGRAAQRMTESAGVEAKTIHRLLGWEDGHFAKGEYKPLDAKFVIIDEASMLDTHLAAAVAAAVPDGAHLVLVGDIDQLPSVGAGNVLKDVIASQKFSVARLSKIFRQGERSQIVFAAHRILRGDDSVGGFEPRRLCDVDKTADVSFIYAETPEECAAATVELISQKIPLWYGVDPIFDVQLLAPMHKGSAGISSFNAALKVALNPSKETLFGGGSQFSEGDKIMQTRNNYEIGVFNGDMGCVADVARDNSGIHADFDGRKIFIPRGELGDFQQAYAISIHKSQGSEFPIVVMPLMRQHFVMLQRNLLYTGLTRGRKKVFIVGQPEAWSAAVRNSRAALRRTFLKNRLESI